MKEINRERFEAWLFSQPPERTFDYSDADGGCVVCCFVRETTGYKNVVGGSDTGVKLNGYSSDYVGPLPEWLAVGNKAHGVLAVFEHEARDGKDNPITIAAMQKRYLQLFPDAPVNETKAAAQSARPLNTVMGADWIASAESLVNSVKPDGIGR